MAKLFLKQQEDFKKNLNSCLIIVLILKWKEKMKEKVTPMAYPLSATVAPKRIHLA